MTKMYEIYEKLLIAHGVTSYKVSQATGIAQTTLSNWKAARSTPNVKTIQKIADYFGVSMEFMMTGKKDEKEHLPYYFNQETKAIAQAAFENPDIRLLVNLSREMSPECLKALLSFIQKLKEENKDSNGLD